MEAPDTDVRHELAPTARSLAGVVVEFDDDRGLGVVGAQRDARYPFHCTAVADGSRHVDVGADVRFVLVPGHAGRLEASDLVPSPATGGGLAGER
ncbi:MAG: hypothetical protein JWO62_1514 [Acidimicrobiaceae bacterium]|nr:hypothetical protein [Acidimicrobiaceae bacterium]